MPAPGLDRSSHSLRALRNDKGLWLASAVLVVALAPFVLPGLSVEQRRYWGDWYADSTVYAAVLISLLVGLKGVSDARERRFWGFVALAFGAAAMGEALTSFVPASVWNETWDLFSQASYEGHRPRARPGRA